MYKQETYIILTNLMRKMNAFYNLPKVIQLLHLEIRLYPCIPTFSTKSMLISVQLMMQYYSFNQSVNMINITCQNIWETSSYVKLTKKKKKKIKICSMARELFYLVGKYEKEWGYGRECWIGLGCECVMAAGWGVFRLLYFKPRK